MEQHSIPRQITTFEFKLIGFLTLKQFIFIIIFAPIGFIIYKLFPIPLLNAVFGALVGGIGLALAFVPINDRPLDLWIKNLIKRMVSPTQYLYHKNNQSVYFLDNLFFVTDPHRVMAHIESKEKLQEYLVKTKQTSKTDNKKQRITSLLINPSTGLQSKKQETKFVQPGPQIKVSPVKQNISYKMTSFLPAQSVKEPFFTGVVKNHKLIPLPGIMIYVKDEKQKTIRLLKTNPHGVFATFNPLPPGEYTFEVKDPRSSYFFDTMKIAVDQKNQRPFEIFSKELI